jgi:hypothetical protein
MGAIPNTVFLFCFVFLESLAKALTDSYNPAWKCDQVAMEFQTKKMQRGAP